MDGAYRLMFVPVSSARGTGEYARALAFAQAVRTRLPDADIRFLVSAEAPYAQDVPFTAEVLPTSPTFHPREVALAIARFRPHLVFFDNAGTTKHLRAARSAGARIVYVSSRLRQRQKAFRWKWMRLIDEHWIACPVALAGAATWFEQWRLRWLRRPTIRYLDVLVPRIADAMQRDVLARAGVDEGAYVLIVAGGGTAHRDVVDGPGTIARAAALIATAGHPVVLVGITCDEPSPPSALRQVPVLPMPELTALIRGARLVVTNGGDTLLQVLALRRACVSVALAPDQSLRLTRLAAMGVNVEVPLDDEIIARSALDLLSSVTTLEQRVQKDQTIDLRDCLEAGTDALVDLLHAHAREAT